MVVMIMFIHVLEMTYSMKFLCIKLVQKNFDELYDMVVDEEFDTDAVEMDVNNNKLRQSNIINFIKKLSNENVNNAESDLLLSVGDACIENVSIYGDINSQYSAG
eukprot:137217_1